MTGLEWDDPRFEEWRERKAAVLGVAATIVGDHLLRQYLLKRGITPFSIFTPIIIARLGVEVVGTMWAYMINDEDGVTDWMYASNKMFSWWGLEDTMLGSPLNLIPNPVEVTLLTAETTELYVDDLLSKQPDSYHGGMGWAWHVEKHAENIERLVRKNKAVDFVLGLFE